MAQDQSSNPSESAKALKGELDSSGLTDEAKMAIVGQFFGDKSKDSSRDTFANGINAIPGVPSQVKLKLLNLRFPGAVPLSSPGDMKPQGVPDAPPGAAQPKDDQSWWDKPLLPMDSLIAGPQKNQGGIEQFGRGILQGAAQGGANLSTPKSIATMGAMGVAQAIPYVGEVVDAGAALYLGFDEAKRIVNSVPAAVKAYLAGDWGKLGNIVGDDVVSVLVTGKAVKRGAGKAYGAVMDRVNPAPDSVAPPGVGTGVNSAEVEPVGPPGSQRDPQLAAGPQQQRIGGSSEPNPRQLQAPDARRDQIQSIASAAGPFKGAVDGWAGKSLQEITELRQRAVDNYQHVLKQSGAENAPFSDKTVPRNYREVINRAKYQADTLEALWRMKRQESGFNYDSAQGGPPVTPMGGQPPRQLGAGYVPPENVRQLQIGQGGQPQTQTPPPPGAGVSPLEYDYRRPEAQAGGTPPSRQIADPEPRVNSPQKSFDEHLEMARTMPREILENNISKMKAAAANRAQEMLKAAGKDPAKKAEVQEFIQHAKGYIEQFEKILGGESSNIGQAADAGMTGRIANQFEAAKSQGVNGLTLTVDRGAGKKPLKIGVNLDHDTPEELAKQVAKAGGASGMAHFESTDPDRPLQWKFLLGDAAAPPGAK